MRYRIFTVSVSDVELDVQLDTKPNIIAVTAIFPVHDEIDLMPIMRADAIKEAKEQAIAMFWKQEPKQPEEMPTDWRERVEARYGSDVGAA